MCKQYFGLEQGSQTVEEYSNQVVTICTEKNMYQLLSINVKVMERQRLDVDVVWFLLGLKSEYELFHAQSLDGSSFSS